MFRRVISIVVFLLSFAIPFHAQQENHAIATSSVEPTRAEDLAPSKLPLQDKYLLEAYNDTFAILGDNNACSSFYGGSLAATRVLNEFVKGVKRGHLPDEISLEMAGSAKYFRDVTSGVSYRLFATVIVNGSGAFYRHPIDHWERVPHDIGGFRAGSRPARALILLHELAHLIRGNDGEWLIADDGRDGWQSRENTRRIQDVCVRKLRPLQ